MGAGPGSDTRPGHAHTAHCDERKETPTARVLTPERQKLRLDALRLRQEMGWSIRQIAGHLRLEKSTIHRWLSRELEAKVSHNTAPLFPNNIYRMDCLDGLRRLPHDSVDLVFADPPYNIGVDYGNGGPSLDRHEAYWHWCAEWFQAVHRVLKPGGSFYAMHYPECCAEWLPRLLALRFGLQRWITWCYPTNVGQSSYNWTRSQRTILFLTKGEKPRCFNGLADAQPYRNLTDKRIKENLKTRPGIVPYDHWEYNLVKNVSQEKQAGPPNQLPEALLRRIILTSSNEGDLVVDPFSGSGTTAFVASQLNRQYIAFEQNLDYVKVAQDRVANGKL